MQFRSNIPLIEQQVLVVKAKQKQTFHQTAAKHALLLSVFPLNDVTRSLYAQMNPEFKVSQVPIEVQCQNPTIKSQV